MKGCGLTTVFLILSVAASAIPKPDEPTGSRSSDKEHFPSDQHNLQYDHEAFLGEEAKTFDELEPDESRRRLGLIVEKIDADHDGFVSQEELKDWIRYTQKKYLSTDIDRQWRHINPENKPTITWDEYRLVTFGIFDGVDLADLEKEQDGHSYVKMIKRDMRRWAAADRDEDKALNKEEFGHFLHPDEAEHMRDLVVIETMEDIDKDHDGRLSVEEYIGDMFQAGAEGDIEPDWVKSEREQFATYRDRNHDGYLDAEEVKMWIIPSDFDHADAEARHLIYEADADADNKLTKDEIINKYDLFVGSQATDFGEALARHDEF